MATNINHIQDTGTYRYTVRKSGRITDSGRSKAHRIELWFERLEVTGWDLVDVMSLACPLLKQQDGWDLDGEYEFRKGNDSMIITVESIQGL